MKKISLILLILAIPVLLLAAEPVRVWKSKSGKTIEASFDVARDSDSSTVHLINNGVRYKIPFDKLSQADQNYVTKVRENSRSLDEDFKLDNGSEEKNRGLAVVPTGNQYVLLIGVNKYILPIKSLKFCVKDMELLAECFQKIGVPKENIFLVTDDSPIERCPTGAVIRRQIENITRIMGSNDQLIIAFSGHGVMVDGKSYICPSDTDIENKNSIVSCDWVFEQLEKCKAKQKIFIIDACRSEISIGGEKSLGNARTLEDPIGADTHGFILMASCDKKQQSWEHPNIQHGVFIYFLAEGLSGAAKDEDGYITIMNLFQYTSSKTKKYIFREFSKVQVPTIRLGGEMTDFCLAKLERTSSSLSPSSPVPTFSAPLIAGTRKVYTVNGVDFAFRYCPPGTFMMGSPESEAGHSKRETQHQVTLTQGFWIMETEVTVGMFKAFVNDTKYQSKGSMPCDYLNIWGSLAASMDSQRSWHISWLNPGFIQDDNHPVTCVSWDDANSFCEWLSKKTSQKIQLPTLAQWEYACRAETTGMYAGNLDEMAWYDDNSEKKTHPVGTKKSNAWGLYDMHGNVCEWCQDRCGSFGNYSNESVTDPIGSSSGSDRAIHGGCWLSPANLCRSAFYDNGRPDVRGNIFGFRVVKDQ